MYVLTRLELDTQVVEPKADAVSLLLRLGALVLIRPLHQLITVTLPLSFPARRGTTCWAISLALLVSTPVIIAPTIISFYNFSDRY